MRRFRGPGRSTIAMGALLLFVVWSLSAGLKVRGLDPDLIASLSLLGLAIGWLLAISPLSARAAVLIALGLDFELLILRVGQLGRASLALISAMAELARDWAAWFFFRTSYLQLIGIGRQSPPDGVDMKEAFVEVTSAISVLSGRVGNWLSGLASGHAEYDPVAVALVWGTILFAIANWMTWSLARRERPFEALLPALALLGATLVYTGGNPWLLLPFLLALLLFLPLSSQRAREGQWERNGIGFSEEIRFDMGLVVIPLTLLLLTVSAIVPSISIRDLVQAADRVVRQDKDRPELPGSFGLEAAARPTTVFDQVQSVGLPREHLVGMRPEESKKLVMLVQVTGGASSATARAIPISARYYWRSTTYDWYSGIGWYAGDAAIQEMNGGQTLPGEMGPATRRLQQQVTFVGPPDGLVYVAGQLFAVDREYRVALRAPGDLFSASIPSPTYRAESLLVAPTREQLSQTGTAYPDWIASRYLELPTSLPPRVTALARDLTATGKSPIDRALAIETFLRTFPYSLDVPFPPPGRDVADYFLFDLRQGYCDYYATAMVVLARAAGLPARLVVGYATGDYDRSRDAYMVTAGDAHSWPEIYFAGYGWVEFEPTAARQAIDRAGEANRPYFPEPHVGFIPPQPGFSQEAGRLIPLLLAACALAAVGTLGLLLRSLRFDSSPRQAILQVYGRLYAYARRFETGSQAGRTPYETTAALNSHLRELYGDREHNSWSRDQTSQAIVRASEEMNRLATFYVAAQYSGREPDLSERIEALRSWKSLRPLLWNAWLRQIARRH